MNTSDPQQVEAGWSVYGTDGEKIGEVSEVGSTYVGVQRGTLFPARKYVPDAAVVAVDPDERSVVVVSTRADFDSQGWEQPPGIPRHG